MKNIKIKVRDCQPDNRAPNVSRKDLDEIEWINEDAVDHRILFDKLTDPIFKGYGTQPDLPLPANGRIGVQVLEDAPLGVHDYVVSGDDCGDDVDPGAIVVDA
jgi:hypothetical protein